MNGNEYLTAKPSLFLVLLMRTLCVIHSEHNAGFLVQGPGNVTNMTDCGSISLFYFLLCNLMN